MVEAHGPQSESPGQETDVGEQDADGILEAGQFLENRGRLDQMTVALGLLHLNTKKTPGYKYNMAV